MAEDIPTPTKVYCVLCTVPTGDDVNIYLPTVEVPLIKTLGAVEHGYNGPAYNGNLSRTDKFVDHRGVLVAITDKRQNLVVVPL